MESDQASARAAVSARPASPTEDRSAEDRRDLTAVAHGDEHALARLRDRHASDLLRFLRRRCPRPEDAEEVLGDVFLATWRHAAGWRGDSSVRGWLFGVARRRARDAQRRRRVLTGDDAPLAALAHPGPGPEAVLLGRPSALGLVPHVEALPSGIRDVLALAFDQRMPHADIAAALGIPVGTVKSRLSEGRRRLRPHLPG